MQGEDELFECRCKGSSFQSPINLSRCSVSVDERFIEVCHTLNQKYKFKYKTTHDCQLRGAAASSTLVLLVEIDVSPEVSVCWISEIEFQGGQWTVSRSVVKDSREGQATLREYSDFHYLNSQDLSQSMKAAIDELCAGATDLDLTKV